MTLRRLLLAAASGLVLLAGPLSGAVMAQTTGAQTAGGQTTTAQPSDPWAQTTSDVPADPAVRFGVLPNGMKYAILRNATPPNQAALRLRFDAGSLSETDAQKGLAHFLEHMAFNGSNNIPEGEMTRRLERLGLSFGGDTNAFTSFDQTAYTLNLPNTTDEVVETSLFVLRETASELLFDAAAVDSERGVIVGEERTRDVPGLRAIKAQFAFLAPGQRLADRFPIGDLNIIRTAPRDEFVDFYRKYYRPERATMIAVGDFDVAKMEAQIATAFGSWVNPAADGPEPVLGDVQPRQTETRIFQEAGVQSSTAIFWTKPFTDEPDTVANRREDLVRSLGMAVLNRRFSELARAENPPFLAAGGDYEEIIGSLEAGTLNVNYNPGEWKRALETVEQELRRMVQYGATQAELDREITEIRTRLTAAVASAATRQTPTLAGALLSAANENEVFSTPATQLEIFEATVADLRPEAVNTAFRDAFTGNGPLAFVTTPVAIEGGEAAITAALEASRQVPVAAPVAVAAMAWPYTRFGTPTEPDSRTEIADLGTTLITFANGVKLTVKPTTFTDEQILVNVRVGNGLLDLPKDGSIPAIAAPVVIQGGLGQLTQSQLEQVLASDVVATSFSISPDAYTYGGATRPEDFELQMQLLAAFFTDSAWRPEPFARFKSLVPAQFDQIRATPGGALALDGEALLSSGDRRFGLPPQEAIAAAELSSLRAAVEAGVAQGPIEITVVGDVTVEAAIAAVGQTFGALPARPAATAPSADSLVRRFPAPTPEPVRIVHTGLPTQALAYVAWPTVDSIEDRTEGRIVGLLARVLQLRVTDKIREELGIAYSPGASATSSNIFPAYGYAFVQAEVPPENLGQLFETVDEVAAALRDTPIEADELTRARLSAVEGLRRSQAQNGWWLANLSAVQARPGDIDAIRTAISDLEAVTPADIQRVAQAYLKPGTAWRAEVTAAGAEASE
ncbi:peptidase M16 [Brevundimonas sp. LM2]|uniref:M16 family metallopeptidase n=1 Tax=Brevundimonas sp. LM2 TaxID=1938605 RepID=UPI000983EAE5|nr:M16 family metallopeptidase [Brevundimonas sp. LM2]AQR61108.1 peptidase M16 [Brevundimonas sp. LM2]